jgi:nitroreductase
MDVIEAINKRRSIRAFKPDPVPQEILREIIQLAQRAPSWANTQPWEFAIVTGSKLKQIQDGFLAKGLVPSNADVARPPEIFEPYSSRIRALPPINRPPPTKEQMESRRTQNFRHYGAPAVIYLLVGRSFLYQTKGINVWAIYDCGSAVQNLMLVATSYGLGTIALAQAVVYCDVVRKVLEIPESRLIALGIAIGYPDWDNPANQNLSGREPLDNIAKWYGF